MAVDYQDSSRSGSRPGYKQARHSLGRGVGYLKDRAFYFGVSLFLAACDLILGIPILTKLYMKQSEVPLFVLTTIFTTLSFITIICLAFLLRWSSLIRNGPMPRSPTFTDATCSTAVAFLFVLSGAAITSDVPSRCYAGPNPHFVVIGRAYCGLLTTVSVFTWLGALIMVIPSSMIYKDAREALDLAKLPPPTFPGGAEPMVMRWLTRQEAFTGAGMHHARSASIRGAGRLV